MGRAPCCHKVNVKRGPWSPEEDAALKGYIEKNGAGGNWIALPHKVGLKRCGKRCRLRWLNYLRPDIKHEDNIICTLYDRLGSRFGRLIWVDLAKNLISKSPTPLSKHRPVLHFLRSSLRPSKPRFSPAPISASRMSSLFNPATGCSRSQQYRQMPFPERIFIEQVVSPSEEASAASSWSVNSWCSYSNELFLSALRLGDTAVLFLGDYSYGCQESDPTPSHMATPHQGLTCHDGFNCSKFNYP